MVQMSDAERDTFLLERRVGVLGIGRNAAGPLLAPIWYRYTPGAGFEIYMGGSTAKVRRLHAEGRASICVQDEARPYRYVSVEGPVTVEYLGSLEQGRLAIEPIASRYLGAAAGAAYAEAFRTPDEVLVRLTPQRWQTAVIG